MSPAFWLTSLLDLNHEGLRQQFQYDLRVFSFTPGLKLLSVDCITLVFMKAEGCCITWSFRALFFRCYEFRKSKSKLASCLYYSVSGQWNVEVVFHRSLLRQNTDTNSSAWSVSECDIVIPIWLTEAVCWCKPCPTFFISSTCQLLQC